MKISVVLPTYRRPTMLRAALKSIQSQSRREWIVEVIVSENGLEPASRGICAEFPDLPIKYIYQETSITAYRHIYTTMLRATSEWVAMIGDDDMWSRYHLEEAGRMISTYQADGYSAQGAIVENESRQIVRGYIRPMCATLPPESNEFRDFWQWTPEQCCQELLTRIPINLWTVVAKRDYLMKAFSVFGNDESYDCDRLACWRLLTTGRLVMGREIGLFIRMHEASWSKNLWQEDPDFHTNSSAEHSQAIIDEAQALGVDAKKAWTSVWERLDPRMKEEVWKTSFSGPRRLLKEKWAFDPGLNAAQSGQLKSRIVHIMKQVTPPVIWALLGKALSR